jgi:hypothetical protein
MPGIPCPNFFRMVPFYDLTKHRFNPITLFRQPMWIAKLLSFCRLIGRQQIKSLLFQGRLPLRFPIIAVTQRPALYMLKQFFCGFGIMHVGWRKRGSHDYSRPADTHMGSQAIIDLSGNFVISKSCLTGKDATAISTGKPADGHREAVHNRYQRVMRYHLAQKFKELFFDDSQIGR